MAAFNAKQGGAPAPAPTSPSRNGGTGGQGGESAPGQDQPMTPGGIASHGKGVK